MSELAIDKVPLLDGLPESLVSAIAAQRRVRHYSDGDLVFASGDNPDCCYIIVSGVVQVRGANNAYIVQRMAGEVIGEQALLDDAARSASAVAVGNVRLLPIGLAQFRSLMDEYPRFSANLCRALSDKLRKATDVRAVRFAREERLFRAFRAHCSPEVSDRLLNSPTFEDDWCPENRDLTVLYCDIRGFSKTCQRALPVAVASELSDHLDRVIGAVYAHGGMVDKFIGDAVLALFGYPEGQTDDASRAFRCGRDVIEAGWHHTISGEPIRIGVGIASGSVFCGNIGNAERQQFTVIGHVVNLAARLESETKTQAASMLVCEETYRRAEEAVLRHGTVSRVEIDLHNIGPTICYRIGD